MKVYFPNSFYNYPYRVTQYTFHIKTDKVDFTRPVTGQALPVDVLMKIKDAPEGTVIEFSGIRVTCPECTEKTIGDFKMKIK